MERAGTGAAPNLSQAGCVVSVFSSKGINLCHLSVVRSGLSLEVVASGKDSRSKCRSLRAATTVCVGCVDLARPLGGFVEDHVSESRSGTCVRRRKVCAPPSATLVREENLAGIAEALEHVFNRDFRDSDADKGGGAALMSTVESHPRSPSETGTSEASSSSPVPEKVPKRRRTASAKMVVVDVGVQKTFSSNRSVAPSILRRSAGELGGKRRLNLVSRIALRKRRLESVKDRLVLSKSAERTTLDAEDIWSDEAEYLIEKHGSSLDFAGFEWDNLERGLLTPNEEISLTRLMRPAKRLAEIRLKLQEQMGEDPADEAWANAANLNMAVLRRQLILGLAARNKVIKKNLRLVLFQAHKYYMETSSLSLFDLCQEGVTGLIHAVDRFDPDRGHRFSTYAVYWVRNSILRAQTRSGCVLRSPYNVAMHKLNIKKARLDLLVELERTPTHKEVMDRLGLNENRYRDILRSCSRAGSFHAPNAQTGKEIGESIADNNDTESRVFESRSEAVLRFGMDDVLDSLKPKESLVLRQRYGLDGKGERTLCEIGRNLNMSKEMVRRYETCGLMKMKHPARVDYLRKYLV